MNGQDRKYIAPRLTVEIVLKEAQRTEKKTRGVIKDVLTKSLHHPLGIKVCLETDEIGRGREIIKISGARHRQLEATAFHDLTDDFNRLGR